MPKILNFFDEAYYINLDARVDRREVFETRSKEAGISAKRFPAIQLEIDMIPSALLHDLRSREVTMSAAERDLMYRTKANEIGCAMSHKAVVKEARDQGLQNVLIFEDDCKFLPDWHTEIAAVVADLATVDWDVMYFGGELNSDAVSITNNLNLVVHGGVYCCHSYAVNRRFFDTIINFDLNWCPAIDIFLLQCDTSLRKYVVSKKLLTIQESNWSDLRNQNTNASQIHLINSWKRFIK